MKKLWILPVFLLLVVSSCQRKKCITYGVGGFELIKNTGTTTDSSVTIYQYNKNTSFTGVLDTYRIIRAFEPQQSAFLGMPWGNLQNGAYDYKLVFHPSGHTLRISNIYAENNTGNGSMSCVNPVHYTVNDTLNTVPGYLGMDAFYLPIAY
jgi:hypothetical protein